MTERPRRGPGSWRGARRGSTLLGAALTGIVGLAALASPVLAPHGVDDRFPDLLDAPPTLPHVFDGGRLRPPFIHPWKLVNRLEQRYEPDAGTSVPLVWFRGGRLVSSSDDSRAPLLILGADSYGRDVFSRLLFGSRVSIALSLAAAAGAAVLGGLFGALAGYLGGAADDLITRTADAVMLLPAMYVALALRALLPPVVPPAIVFVGLAAIFAVIGAPFVLRGVRDIVGTERRRESATAAVALGAGPVHLLVRHLLPAARGFIATQMTMLTPAFIVAEATLSYVGFGFGPPVTSWGTMLQETSNVRAFSDFPWLLSPAAAIFAFVLGLNLLIEDRRARRTLG